MTWQYMHWRGRPHPGKRHSSRVHPHGHIACVPQATMCSTCTYSRQLKAGGWHDAQRSCGNKLQDMQVLITTSCSCTVGHMVNLHTTTINTSPQCHWSLLLGPAFRGPQTQHPLRWWYPTLLLLLLLLSLPNPHLCQVLFKRWSRHDRGHCIGHKVGAILVSTSRHATTNTWISNIHHSKNASCEKGYKIFRVLG
jgi:hypothetical protein